MKYSPSSHFAFFVTHIKDQYTIREKSVQIDMRHYLKHWLTLCLFLVTTISPANEQHGTEPSSGEDGYQSGYGEITELGGPDGVSEELKLNDEEREFIYQIDTAQRVFKPWFDWKRQVNKDHGLKLGFQAYFLYQGANESLGDDSAFGSIYRFQGSWTAFGRSTGHEGRLEYRIENRSNIGSLIAPSNLGTEVGAAALNTGFGYAGSFSTDLAVLNWTQGFNDNTAGIAVGRLAFDVYLDAFAFQTFSRGFLNRAFVVNPTIGTTGIGSLGAVAKGFVSEQFWIGGQLYDGNAASGDFDFDTFREHEWLRAVELGWTPSFSRRRTDKIQFTYWDKDERVAAGISSGKGWAMSASWQMQDRLLAFFRLGHSDGGAGVAAENAASIGMELTTRADQAFSAGLGWAEPSAKTHGARLRDEYIAEVSYKFQLSKNFSLLPDFQLLIDPALNPQEDRVWVIGLRAIITL